MKVFGKSLFVAVSLFAISSCGSLKGSSTQESVSSTPNVTTINLDSSDVFGENFFGSQEFFDLYQQEYRESISFGGGSPDLVFAQYTKDRHGLKPLQGYPDRLKDKGIAENFLSHFPSSDSETDMVPIACMPNWSCDYDPSVYGEDDLASFDALISAVEEKGGYVFLNSAIPYFYTHNEGFFPNGIVKLGENGYEFIEPIETVAEKIASFHQTIASPRLYFDVPMYPTSNKDVFIGSYTSFYLIQNRPEYDYARAELPPIILNEKRLEAFTEFSLYGIGMTDNSKIDIETFDRIVDVALSSSLQSTLGKKGLTSQYCPVLTSFYEEDGQFEDLDFLLDSSKTPLLNGFMDEDGVKYGNEMAVFGNVFSNSTQGKWENEEFIEAALLESLEFINSYDRS